MIFSKRYIIWNPSVVSSHTSLEAESVVGVVDAEQRTMGTMSSEVKTQDIKQVVEAVYNETNIQLSYAPYKSYSRLKYRR